MSQRTGWTDVGRRGEHHSIIGTVWAFGHRVMGSVRGEVGFEVGNSECQVVSQKETKIVEKGLLFPIVYIPVFHLFDKWIYKKFECSSLF